MLVRVSLVGLLEYKGDEDMLDTRVGEEAGTEATAVRLEVVLEAVDEDPAGILSCDALPLPESSDPEAEAGAPGTEPWLEEAARVAAALGAMRAARVCRHGVHTV